MQVYRLAIPTPPNLTGKRVRIAVTSTFTSYIDILVSDKYGYLQDSEITISDIEVDNVHIVVAGSVPRKGLNPYPIYILPYSSYTEEKSLYRINSYTYINESTGYLYAKTPTVKPPTTPRDELSGCLLLCAEIGHYLEMNSLDVNATKSSLIPRKNTEDIFDDILRRMKSHKK